MNQANDQVIDLYVQQIAIAVSCSNSEQIRQAEDQLQQMFGQDPNSMESLVQIVCSSNIQDNIRLAASLMCKTIQQQQIKRLHLTQCKIQTYQILLEQESLEQQIKYALCFVSCFQNSQLNPKLKTNISEALKTLLSFSKKINERNSQKILEQLYKRCLEIFQFEEIDQISEGIYIIQSLLDSFNGQSDIEKYPLQLKSLKLFLTLGTKIISTCTLKKDGEKTLYQQILSHWIGVSLELCSRALTQKNKNKINQQNLKKLENLIIYNQDFCSSLLNILMYAPLGSKIIFLSKSDDQNIDNLALETFNLVLELLTSERPRSEFKQGPFFHCLYQLIPTLVICLMGILNSQDQNITETLDNQILSQTITQLMKFITLCAEINEFYSIMSEVKSSILLDVILPMLSTSTKEMAQAYDNPEEFVNLAVDTVEKQTSGIAKTAAASLLETFCDHLDGSTSLITQICVLIINHSIQSLWTGQEIFTDDQNNPYFLIFDLKPRIIFQKLNAKQRIDSCLMALSVISYLTTQRQDLILLFENMLKLNLNFFSNPSLDPLLVTRLCLFIGYYSENLFKDENKNGDLIQYINLLISFLTYKDEQCHLVLMYQAVNSLKNIFEDKNLIEKIQPLIPSLLTPLSLGLQQSQYEPHFDMIQSILKLYSKSFLQQPQYFQGILEVLVKRVIADQQLVEKGAKQEQIWINKAWNIFRNIPEMQVYIPTFIQIMINTLAPLFRMMENPIHIEFDEDIILLISSLIAQSKNVDLSLIDFLYCCPKLLEKQKYLLGQMFEMLNNMIYYGYQLFHNIEIQKKYFEIALLSINMQQYINPNSYAESEIGEGVLLIQLGIQKLGPNINDETLKEIFNYILSFSSKKLQTDILKSRLMGVFLSSFLFNFQKSCNILLEFKLLQQVFDHLVDNYSIVQVGYDTKLYVISLIHCFQGSLTFCNSKSLSGLIEVLEKQNLKEVELQQKLKSSQIDSINFDSSFEFGSSDENEIEDDFDEQTENAKISMESFKSDLKQADEFLIFNQFIQFLKNKSFPNTMELLKQELTQNKMQQLQNLLCIHRIQSEQGMNPPRKIVQIGQRKANKFQ